MPKDNKLILIDQIEPMILTIRGHKVILDSDLAALYGTNTGALNQAVRRNKARFPASFMFTLTAEEKQEVITNCDNLTKVKFSPALPNVFTEHGAIMAASILNSPRAVEVSIFVVQAFVKLRQFALNHQEILKMLAALERKVGDHDEAIRQIVLALKHLMMPPDDDKPKRRIGFQVASDDTPQAKTKAKARS